MFRRATVVTLTPGCNVSATTREGKVKRIISRNHPSTCSSNSAAAGADFHTIPFRGDPTALDNHFLPRRGKAGPSVLGFFAQEAESRVLCYANADLTRTDQPGELMRFVEFWHGLTGHDPQWLYFDSKVVPYPELSRINRRGIHFVTIRRRDVSLIAHD